MTTLNHKSIGMTANDIKSIKTFLTTTRSKTSAVFLEKWIMVGDVCRRIKAAKFDGKFSDQCQEILGTPLTNDERTFSMKLHDDKDAVLKWYKERGCMKYNPRTIWTAYQADVNPAALNQGEPPKDDDDDDNGGEKEKELRKARTSTDVLKSFTEFRRVFDNATENGNMKLGDYKSVLQGLEAMTVEVKKMMEFEEDAERTARKDRQKEALKKVA